MQVEVKKGWREVRIGKIEREIQNRKNERDEIKVIRMKKKRGFVS